MRLSMRTSFVILMLMTCRSICLDVHGQSDATTEELMCDCTHACSAYTDDKYDDCANFCSYNQEPLPLCMCDDEYMTAKNRRVHAFNAYRNGTKPKTITDCRKACASTNAGNGPWILWTKTDCFCTCPNYDDLPGYGMY